MKVGSSEVKSECGSTEFDDSIVELVDILQEIDVNKQVKKKNTYSIADNNGGRILF